MQKHLCSWHGKLKRTLAMFLVLVSLFGMVPLDGLDLLALRADAAGAEGSSSGAFRDYVGSGKGDWAPNVTSTPFTRYSLVEYPDEANHPDNYNVLGSISVFPDGTLGANKLGSPDKVTNPDVYWVGAPPGFGHSSDSGTGRMLTAADYDVNGEIGLYWYNLPRAFGFMTVADFDSIARQMLEAKANALNLDHNSEEYKKYYAYDSSNKIIADYHKSKDLDTHVSQFSDDGKDYGTTMDGTNKRRLYDCGDLLNALVMMLSVGRTSANPKYMVEQVNAGKGMTVHEFVDEGGEQADGSCGCSYRILVEPGCMLQDKKPGGKWFICTLRDMIMMSHLENRTPNDTTSISFACSPLVRTNLAFLRYQTCDEFVVYNRKVYGDEKNGGATDADARTKAIDARRDEQSYQFKGLPKACDGDSKYGMGALQNLIFHKHSGMQVHLNNPPSDGIQGGSYALSIITPFQFTNVPPATGLTIKKTSNMTGGGPWKFTVTATQPDGTPFVGTVGLDTFDDTGTCHIELEAGKEHKFAEEFPEGTKFKVVEDDPGDASIVTTVNGTTGREWEGESGTVVFNNTTDKISFSISKSVTGGVDKTKKFHFDVKFDPATDGVTYTINGGSPVTVSGGSCTVELADGETATFEGLADGTKYTVTEQEANQGGMKTTPNGTQSGTVTTGSGVKFVNGDEEEGGGSGKLMKVDAHTGKTVGVAHFRFRGAADASLGYFEVNKVFPTDGNGILEFQWDDPSGPNYIPPGHYTVTEERPPLGYEPSDQAEDLLIKPGDKDLSKALVFKNDPMTGIRLVKTNPKGEKLSGAVFAVYHDGKFEGNITTGSDGTFEYKGKYDVGLENGTYEFVEIQAPAGYLIPKDNRRSVTIDNSNKSSEDPIEISMLNYEVPKIRFLKYETGTSKGLAGAFFEVMLDGEILGEFGPTAEDGSFEIPLDQISGVFSNQEDSWTLNVRETVPPEGYMLNDDDWKTIEIKGGQEVVEVPFHDTKIPPIKIYKRDGQSGEALKGAVFEVFIDGNSIGEYETKEDGLIEIPWDRYSSYWVGDNKDETVCSVTVVEKVAPEGYIIDTPNTQTKPLKRGESELSFTFTDTKYPEIWVRKLDSETGERLADMEFSVQINGVNIGTFRTRDEDVKNNDGWYKITYEQLKEFLGTHDGNIMDMNGWQVTVTEMSPPQFYNYDNQEGDGANGHSYTKTLQPGQNKLMFEFENTHYRSIKVHKVDQEKGWDLKNAEFTLKCIELDDKSLNFNNGWGEGVSKQAKTNAEGWCIFENLPNGWYELVESKAPPGYLGNETTGVTDESKGHWTDTGEHGPRRIHITSGSAADGSVEAPNAPNRYLEYTYANPTPVGVHIFKRDGITGEPIAGVKFVIKSLPPLDPYEETFTTDENGMIVIEDQAYGGLKPGSYEVIETYVPKPYNLPKDGSNSQILKIEDPGRHQSYNLTFNNYPDMYVYAVKRDSKTGLPVPGAKFELTEIGGGRVGDVVTSGENGFAMLGPVEPGKSYTITEIAPPDGYELTIPNHQNFKVPDVTSNWSAEFEFSDNPLCNLWLRKVDATNSNKGLQGAEFRIERANGSIVKQNAVTDNEGYINVKGLEPGDYVAIEITAPPGYMLPEGKDAETRIHLESGKTETILIKNYKPGGLQIRKVDAKTGEALTGAEFQLYDAYEKPIGSPVKVGSDGFARWADLEPGVYFVEETKAPEGYAKTEGKKRFEVVGFESVTYEWPNAEEATITIYKRDGNTELPLAGAEFEVRDLNGAVVDKLVTNRNGTATSKKLPLGYYQIVETKAPAGYQIAEEKSQPIEVKAGSPVVIDRYNWSDKTIIIRKRDVNTQQPLQGAWFELQTIDGEILQDAICTDASGVAVTKQVEPGQYYLVETKAPDGYKIIKEKILVTVEAGKGVSVDVDNMPTTIVQIYKTDAVSGDPIPNTEFALKDKHGKVLEVLMTDISGWAYSQPLPAGDYVVEETQAAPGYIKDTEVHHVELEEGKNFTLMLKNTPGIHITVFKVDGTDTNSEGSSTGGEGAASRKPLPGAVFELETDSTTGDCKYIGTYTTDEYGKFEVEGLAPGFYRLHEKTPPDGYAVVDEYTRICVKAGELNIFYVENVKLATLIVRKLDIADGKPVAGAVFELKTADGKTLGRKETDSNGEAIWTNLLAGHYTVTEAIQPDSYDLTGCPTRSVTVSYGIDNVIEFKDEAYGSLVIILQDKHTGAYLEGGQFVVTNLTNMNIVFDSKTDVTGTLVVGNLAPGWYEIVQKYSPDGYTIIEATQKVEIKLGLQQTIYYVNETAGLVIEKVDSKDTSKTLEGARFKVTRVEDNNVIGEYVTDKSGVALLSNLKPGYYKVEEVAAPLGYEIDDPRPQQVDIHGGKTAHVTFMDTARASITINVVDKATQQGLAGCKVEVWVQNGDKVNEWTSDKTGMIETEKMTPGYYVLKLVKVTDGYKAVLSETTVELKAGIECNFKFECTKSGSVIVAGKDENGNLLAGVKFQLVSIDGTVIGTYVTNSDGTYDLSGIAPGDYVIKWLAGPSGYEVITNVQNITITAGGSVNIDITHKLLSDITIQVNDSGTKTGLANCKIEIWREHGDLVQTIITDNSGTIKTDKLDNGNYVVKLITWPDGYTPVKTEQTITVTYNRTITVQFDCVNSGSLTVSGFDPDGKALAGVKFEIRDLTGKVIGTYETGTDGKYVVSGLAAGFYEIIEISCPDGMSKIESSVTQRVEIKSGSSASVEFKHVADSDVTISVKDQDRKPISGVTIEIWQQNGDKVQTLVTDSTGIVITNKLTAGVYVIKALDVPDGYVLTQSEQVITITANRHITVDFTCSANGGLTVSSTDEKGQLMAGVGFDVKLVSGELIGHYVTNANGTYTINNLKPGRYEITWTSSPDGYNPDESTKVTQVEITSGNSIEITLKHVRQSVINIGVIDKNTLAGLNGAVIEIWQQNGSLVNTFTTDSTGKISVGTLPNGFYVVKLIKLIDGYKAELTETVIEVKTGVEINFNFECVSNGGLTVISKDSAGQAIAGMFFSVTDINGTPVGSYTTGTDGRFILADLAPGWYIVTATKAPEGFNLPSETSQKIEVKAGGSAEVVFQHTKIFGLQIRTTVQQTGVAIGGAVYKVTTLQGLEVCRITSNDAGIGFYALAPGWYVVTPETAPKGYQFADTTPRNVEVKADGLTAIDFLVTQQSSMRIKVIDGTTGAGIYNVRIQLKNSAGVCIKEYYTNDQGIIYLDQVITAGGYVVEMISAPAGYIIDKMPHSLDAENGATTEITYKLYKEGGQIQVVVTSAEYNKTLDLPAGTPLQGAVFEITNPDTFQVVGKMISDASGIAASSALPIGRYTVKMVTAPAYYGINESFNPEVRLKINNDVVRVETTVKSVNLKTVLTQKTNQTAKTGSTIRVDVLAANNASDARLNNFFLHIKVPTDAARIVSINPGTWNAEVFYTISYKTNANDYRKVGQNLSSGNNYTFDLSTQSLGLMPGEYVTDVRFEFGTVPAGFAVKTKTTYGLYIQGVPNGYKMLTRAELGGQHGATSVSTNHVTQPEGLNSPLGGGQPVVSGQSDTWKTATSILTTTITNTGKLPKTGY